MENPRENSVRERSSIHILNLMPSPNPLINHFLLRVDEFADFPSPENVAFPQLRKLWTIQSIGHLGFPGPKHQTPFRQSFKICPSRKMQLLPVTLN